MYKLRSSIYCLSSVTSDVMREARNLYCTHDVRLKSVLFSLNSHMHYKTMIHGTTENRALVLRGKVRRSDQSCKVLFCLF